jgi:hypothetical protein
MNVEIGAEAALFPKKEYSGIFVAVYLINDLLVLLAYTIINNPTIWLSNELPNMPDYVYI